MATNKRITDVALLWESLGTFWGRFPDKPLFTKLWQIYQDIAGKLYSNKVDIHVSKYMQQLDSILERTDTSYNIVLTGPNINVVELSGLNSYKIDNYTASIPSLRGVETGEALVEGVDYEIYQNNYIRFLIDPTPDPNNLGIEQSVTLYADTTYKHNPVLWGIHASGIGLALNSLDNEEYLPYNIIASSGIDRTIDIAEHYKYLIWGLETIKNRPPTVSNLKNGFGLSMGAPFSYTSGIVKSVISNTIIITGDDEVDYTYIIPGCIIPSCITGQSISQFEILASGIAFYDHINDYAYIMELLGTNDFNYPSYMDLGFDAELFGLEHSPEFHARYVSSLIPAGMIYAESASSKIADGGAADTVFDGVLDGGDADAIFCRILNGGTA